GRPWQRVEVGEEGLRGGGRRALILLAGAERAGEQGVRGDVCDQMVGRKQDRSRLVEEDRVRRTVTGPMHHAKGPVSQLKLRAVGEGPRYIDLRSPGSEAGGDGATGRD